MARFVQLSLFLMTIVTLVGCGGASGSGIKVKGTLVQNGKPLQPAPKEDDTVAIVLSPTDKDQKLEPVSALFNHADGTFEFKGRQNAGVPPGEYRVLLNYVPYQGESNDLFREQFNTDNSTLKYTVTNDKVQEIVIDVGKKTITKVESK